MVRALPSLVVPERSQLQRSVRPSKRWCCRSPTSEPPCRRAVWGVTGWWCDNCPRGWRLTFSYYHVSWIWINHCCCLLNRVGGWHSLLSYSIWTIIVLENYMESHGGSASWWFNIWSTTIHVEQSGGSSIRLVVQGGINYYPSWKWKMLILNHQLVVQPLLLFIVLYF